MYLILATVHAFLLIKQATAGGSLVADIPGATYVGCYSDEGTRDLGDNSFSHGEMSLTMCLSFCQNQGSLYFGAQTGDQCFCGDSYGAYGEAENCDNRCDGNRAEECGGGWTNSVFEITEPVMPLPETTYLGCYRDDGNRDLAGPYFNTNQMTLELCTRFCANYAHAFLGLQDDQCFCGMSYGAYGSADEGDCYKTCPGNTDQPCGGNWRSSIYQIEGTFVRAPIATPDPSVALTDTSHQFTLSNNGITYILETTPTHIALDADDYCEAYGMKLAPVENEDTLAALELQLASLGDFPEVATGERSSKNLDVDVPMEDFNAAGWNCVTFVPDGSGSYKLVGKKCDGQRALLCAAIPDYC